MYIHTIGCNERQLHLTSGVEVCVLLKYRGMKLQLHALRMTSLYVGGDGSRTRTGRSVFLFSFHSETNISLIFFIWDVATTPTRNESHRGASRTRPIPRRQAPCRRTVLRLRRLVERRPLLPGFRRGSSLASGKIRRRSRWHVASRSTCTTTRRRLWGVGTGKYYLGWTCCD